MDNSESRRVDGPDAPVEPVEPAAPVEPVEPAEPAEPAESAVPASPLGDLVAAHFQRVEVALLGRVLTTTLAGALPASMVQVERRRTMTERIARRPGQVIGVRIATGDRVLSLRSPDVGATETTVSHAVRGVVLSTERVSVATWLEQLGELLDQATRDDQAARAALERALLP